ncbi:TonB-dependent receptor [Sphingomonas sp. RHCKR47]|uniref:TonB-dependent receptor plug domain-containing protein n=1 Tax=Sphingomonas citricola TaxID=2862498 RepID=UPI001CA48611|nr:TonB-dependent receptor [Sphingomonas citricola]MBW6522758.1 TonB-dependent receptor [Sphingomonas citricola]
MSRFHRCRWLSGAALFVSPLAYAQAVPPSAAPVAAQSTADPAPPADPATDPAASTDGDIVVTGSRIRRPDYEAPTPIVSFGAAALEQSGNTNVTAFLQRVPALTNSLDNTRTAGSNQSDGSFGQVGLNLLDLRGLGPTRTLVLVNGRRHVAGQPDTAAVDINAIPVDLIERVDVLTGAASAVYGADGVSGVVNFVMKRDFDGVAARSQFGISERGDAANRFASLVAGRNFADGRGNVTLAYEYNADQPLANDDRDYLAQGKRQYFVNVDGYDPIRAGSYQKGPVGDLRYPYSSNQGIVYIGDQTFRGDGAIYTPGRFLANDGYTIGGDDTPVAGYIGDIYPRTRRHAVNALAHYDASDAFKISLEGKFVQSTVTSFSGYGGNYPATIALDNPYIPASILNAALAAGLTSIDVNRNNFDIPRRGETDRRRTYRGVIDVAGRISDHASYDVYYTYGQTEVRANKLNDRLNTRFLEALDAVRGPNGTIVCRSASARAAGCLPVNTFGGDTVDPASFDYYLSNPQSNARITQNVVNASLTGDFGQFLELPGGPVAFAAGGEYRRETSRFSPAQALVDNQFYQYDEYIIPTPSSGKFDVWEAFGELNAPLVKDRPFFHLLSVGAAGRYSDYSTVGSTRAYQFNGIWAPIAAISFRGSYGRSVRAPNIGELFRPSTGSSAFFSDPCYLGNRNAGSASRAANCVALINGLGGNPATFTAQNNPDANIFIPGSVSGNPDLAAEVARTWTAGVVLRPDFVPGLSIAVDWYNINLRGAINNPDGGAANSIAELCVDQPTLDNPFCAQITRRQGSGYINGYTIRPANVSAFRTAGAELNVAYRFTTARAGTFDLRLVGGYLDKLEQVATPGAQVENNVDQIFRPRWNATFSPTWINGPLTLSYNLRWQDGVRRFTRFETDNNPSYVDPRYFRYKELWQHDLQAQLEVDDGFSFYAGVNNLADQKPDIGFQTNVPISPVGRYFYAGAKVRLDKR